MRDRPAIALALASASTIVGATLAGAPRGLLVAFGAASLLGLLLHLALSGRRIWRAEPLAYLAALAIVTSSLWGLDIDGARRWIALGPVTLQPALILAPLLLIGPAHWRGALPLLFALAALALAPDRGTLVAVAFAGATKFAVYRRPVLAFLMLAIGASGLLLPDIGAPVDHVEAVVGALGTTPWTVAAPMVAALLLGLFAVAPRGPAHLGHFILWIVLLAMAMAGPYPTPFIGLSASAMIGLWITLAVMKAHGGSIRRSRDGTVE